MTGKTISDAITDINPEYIEKAADYTAAKKARRPAWVKWAAMAACLCLVLAAAAVIPHLRQEQGTQSLAPTVLLGEENYIVCGAGEASILEACGLPAELTSGLAGKFVAYLEHDGRYCYTVTGHETEIELFEYAPEPNANVYIVQLRGNYYAAILRDEDGYYGIESGNSLPQ